MKNLFKLKNSGIAFATIVMTMSSCSDDDATIVQSDIYGNNLDNIALNVVVKNYETLKQNGEAMATAASTVEIGNEQSLIDARNAWIQMRIHWENSESTLYGPAGDEGLGIDGNIDSWPIDLSFVNTVLAGSTNITINFIAEQDSNAKGFHALEFLLWGIDGQKTASQLTAREIDYIKATAGYLSQQTTALFNAWSPSGTNFAVNLTNADAAGSIYGSQVAALVQVVDGVIGIADEVGNGKLQDPMYGNGGNYSLEDEESRFSNNSKADFADNIRGIKYIYSGDYNGNNGSGLSEIVAAGNPNLDAQIKVAIDEAIAEIENIPGTFTNAIVNNRTDVEDAIAKVNALEALLSSQLKPYIQNL